MGKIFQNDSVVIKKRIFCHRFNFSGFGVVLDWKKGKVEDAKLVSNLIDSKDR